MMGIYPCGGKYDDGTDAPADGLTTANGTGVAPVRLLTFADRLYIEAELIAVGKRTGNASTVLDNAINASFAQVNAVASAAKLSSQTVPEVQSGPYRTSVGTEFSAASDAKKLEIIMTQKWISSFGTSHDQYTDYRRTGYPVMFDPQNPAHAPSGFVTGGPHGSGPVPVQRTRDYPLSWPYYADELTLNNNAPDQKIITTSPVFWDVD